jgi:DNA-binding transcriptional LysR family regulator
VRNLEFDQLRAFALVAELKSFTAAGDCLGATQSAISLRIAKLETAIGARLLARTPRAVALTADGARFLAHAEAILARHDAALAELESGEAPVPLRLAVSDHAAGAYLPSTLAALKTSGIASLLDVVVGPSTEMRQLFDQQEADAAVVRSDTGRRGATPLFKDPLCWAKAEACLVPTGESIPLVALRGICSVKAATIKALDRAHVSWRYAFLGGSVSALQAAVRAGLGVGVFGINQVPAGCLFDGPSNTLPELPATEVVMYTRLTAPMRSMLVTAFQAGRRAALTPRAS